VAIKVSGVVRGSTHVPLVLAVADRLQVAGVRPDRITIYDRTTGELRDAGFPITSSGDRVRCCGTNDDYAGDWAIQGTRIRLSRVLVDCDALLNIPVLKAFTSGTREDVSRAQADGHQAPIICRFEEVRPAQGPTARMKV
jgi:hypothetical protein